MIIRTNRLWIRPFTMNDLNDVYEYCHQPGVGKKAGWPAHESPEQTAGILTDWIQEGCKHAVVWLENGKVIGHVSVDPDSDEGREDTRELGCALNREYQRRGIMTEAITAVVNYLFHHEIEYIWACCFQQNIPSKRMIEKSNFVFQQEGTYYAKKLQKMFASYEYRLSKNEWRQLSQHNRS